MSSQNTYFVNVDGLYRDNSLWPNPTDFGINFTTFSGTGTFVQGAPLNADSFFQQASIDPDYLNNNLQFVNATMQQIDRTALSLTVSGIFDYTKNFSIEYLETRLYLQTGNAYPLVSPFPYSIYNPLMNVPFIAKFAFDANATVPYTLSWISYIRPSYFPTIYYNYTSKSTFQLSSAGDYYWLFDFSMRYFDFIIYKNGVANYLASAGNPTIDSRKETDHNGNFGYVCACLSYIKGDGDIGIVNKHAYGYHIFSNTYNVGDAIELANDRVNRTGILPQTSVQNSILVDQSDNTIVSLNVDPFTFVQEKTSYFIYDRGDYGNPTYSAYLYEDSGNPFFTFNNASGAVIFGNNQVAFSPNLINFGSGSYECFFIVDNPSSPYLGFNFIPVETGTAATLWVNASIMFTGPANELFYWNSNLPNLSVTASTGTKIYSVDQTTFQFTQLATVPTTGAASCAFSQLGGTTYLFSQNIGNYLDVYTFNTSTYVVTRITGIQIPDAYLFVRNLFTTKTGTDIYIWSIPKGPGNQPSSFWQFTVGTVFVLRFDTTTNILSVISTFVMGRDVGYNAQVLSVRASNKYMYSLSSANNKIETYDITNPYAVVKKISIDVNSTNNLFHITQTKNGSTKYYLICNQLGGGQNKIIFDITNVDQPVKLGKNITAIGNEIGELFAIKDGYSYGRTTQGVNIYTTGITVFFKREKLPFFDQTMTSTQYNQNIAATLTSPVGAIRCSPFNLNDQTYVAFVSNTALTIYNITSVRSTQFVSSIPLSFATTIYDMQTISYNNQQYFLVCGVGFVFKFILNPNLTSISGISLYTAIADAYGEALLFIYDNVLLAICTSYTARVYRFDIRNAVTLTAPPYLTLAGKVPACIACWFESSNNKQYAIVTTTNFATSNDFYFYFDVGTSLTLVGAQFITAPGAQPRSGTTIVNPSNSQPASAGYASIGFGLIIPNKLDIFASRFTFVNTQACNIPTTFNGMCRLFYTDTLYCIVNQYGGPGTLGDYMTCFEFSVPDYGIQTFQNAIASVGTGATSASPVSNLDMRIAQRGDQTTLILLNNTNTFYLYDISNPKFAGKSQSANLITNTSTILTSFGDSYIYKLTNEGNFVYNNTLRNYNTGTGLNGCLVSTSNVKISKDNLSIYVAGCFTDQIQLYNPLGTSPVNQIQAFGQNVNGYVAKFDAITGQWAWIVPIYGSGDDFLYKLQYLSSANKVVICGFTSSEDMLVYQKQVAGSLVNPIVFQTNIPGSVSSTSGVLICIDSNGTSSWYATSFSDESSTNVNYIDVGVQNDVVAVSGYTNAGIVQTIDSSGQPVQNLYSKVTNLGQNAIFTYTFNTSGVYQKSTFTTLPNLTQGKPTDIKLFSDLNLSSYCFYVGYQAQTTTEYYNKDGTLAHTDTGPSNTVVSYVVDYLNDSRVLDSNGTYYSNIVLANPPPYPFTGGFMTNYSMYILGAELDPVLNKNFSIRTNEEDPTGTYRIVLNNNIDTSKIDRNLFSVNGITGSNDYYNINISTNPLSSIFEYNISAQPTSNNTITSIGLTNLNTKLTYYLTFPKGGIVVNIPVINVVQDNNGDYVFQLADVNDLREYPGGPFYGPYIYLTSFNKNVFYNLQFFPANITTPVYYTISLRSLVLPNRPLRQADSDITTLSSMPYIYLAIFCVDVNDKADTEIVNIVYDNNPNRENVAIFQLNTIAAGDASNFVTYSTTMTPRIKFLPKFNTLRVQLFDRNGDLLLFDNTPYKATDAKYKGGVVPPSLMNISVQFLLTKIA